MSETPTTSYDPVIEGFPPGKELQNYIKKTASEDGTYVIVTTHSERIERIPQPLTPEELAQKRKDERLGLAIVGGLGLAFLTFIGVITYMDEKAHRKPVVSASELGEPTPPSTPTA